MLYILQLIYIKEGQEIVFDQFENVAISLISKYNGTLLIRERPNKSSLVEINMKAPYEIHLVSFPSESDFDNFLRDEERKSFLHLKQKSIQSHLLIKGEEFPN